MRHPLLRLALLLFSISLAGCGTEDGSDAPPTPSLLPAEPVDLWIRGGLVVDGTGAEPRVADLLVREGRIVFVGRVEDEGVVAGEVVDAGGRIVTPGFIDPHSHGDPLETPHFRNFLAQGVTTIVLGQDGGSVPAGEMVSWLDSVDAARPGVNVATLVGHNTIRMESGVGHGVADAAGRVRMAELVARGMDAGAFGLSTGLEYDPGARADLDELVAIAEPVAARDGVVSSHMRNEDADQVEWSLAELLEQGRRSGAAVNATHLKVVLGNDPHQAHHLLAMMAEAREEGLRVTGDVYPYTASFTGTAILFPEWARPPHDYDAVVRTRREELTAHLRARVESRNGPDATLFGTGPWNGMTLAEAGAREGRPWPDLLVELGPSGARAAYFVMDEGVMTTFLQDPWVAVSTDGSPVMAHPRGYGSFPRILGRFVRDEGLLSLAEAIRKMTSLPASIFGLDDPERSDPPRGQIADGWAADLLIFDLDAIQDPADFSDPHQLAEGMTLVFVNGERVWGDGVDSAAPRYGRALRRRSPPPPPTP